MASDSKYLNFAVEAAEHKKLKLLCFYRGCWTSPTAFGLR